jgi:hypothetical protein
MSRPPQRKRRRITQGYRNQQGPPPQPSNFSQALGHNDGNAGTGLSIGSPKINPVEDGGFTDAEDKMELNKLGCETSESALLYLAADDSNDEDWLPPRMAKKIKRKTNGPTSKFLSLG